MTKKINYNLINTIKSELQFILQITKSSRMSFSLFSEKVDVAFRLVFESYLFLLICFE